MNILVLQDHLRNGGTERQSVLLARAFAGAGHRVTLLTFRPGGALDFPSAPPSLRRAALQPFDTRLDWFAPGLHRAARRLAPDIVLCMGRMANCRAAALQRALPRSTVVTTMRTGKELPRACVRTLRATRHTIANSREAARVLVTRHALPSEKITVIHNALVFPPSPPPGGSGILPVESSGTDTAPHGNTPSPAPVAPAAAPASTSTSGASSASTFNLNSPPHSLRVRNGATAQTVVLLCVAMFRPEKNHRALLKLAARLPRPPHFPPHLPPSPCLPPCLPPSPRLSCPSASGAPASGITHPPASGAPVSGTTHPPASGALPC
ncbi:MAG: glycosyltransferase, partial [Opitutaceae bacterium]|nr:glycosyltransferase [Opitutaceae bacterium]